MKKHISIIAGILLLFATSTLFSQNNSETAKKLVQSIRSHNNLEVSFTYQTIGDPDQTEETKEGKAYFQSPAYKVIMEDQEMISDGKTRWHYIIEDKEVMVGNATEKDDPIQILDELQDDNSEATPVFDEKGNLTKINVEVDEGIMIVLNILEMKFDQDYQENFFSFDEKAHPDVEIIDMR